MNLNLQDIFFFSILFLLIYIVYLQVELNRIAKRAAKRYCEQAGVQFLDQNVVLKGLSIARSSRALFAFKRHYCFEFASVGDRRYQGKVILLGRYIQSIELEVYKTEWP